ncbi:MAG TPA: acyl-CoA dehydrogenase family protein [Actinomycetota bacterium]|jgi:alkylation response protein AidB-like acyl-CoA dehydrogenase
MSPGASAPIEWVTPDQERFFHDVLDFARTLPDRTVEHDRTETFDREAWDRCGAFGLMGLPAAEEHGGTGADVVTTMLALEALGEGCTDGGLVFSINAHLWTSVVPISAYGNEDQQGRWLPGLCSGSLIGCHAITEPDAGSDVFSISASGRKTDDGWVLKAGKTFITNAPVADLLIVFVRTSEGIGPYGLSAFMIEKGTPGLTVSPPFEKMGLRTSPMAEVVLDECVVPEDAMLGRPGRGGEVFTHSMRWERACIMASQVGVMRRTMRACAAYARERRQFGQPIGKFESIADKIANMKIAIDAARGLVLRVGWLMDHGHDAMVEAAVAKAFVGEAAVQTQLDAVQIHGGYGYMVESGIERGLRDAVAGRIYSGTTEIQRRIVARSLGL